MTATGAMKKLSTGIAIMMVVPSPKPIVNERSYLHPSPWFVSAGVEMVHCQRLSLGRIKYSDSLHARSALSHTKP
jgi:hypothetical protein